jgi:hypothetical protein
MSDYLRSDRAASRSASALRLCGFTTVIFSGGFVILTLILRNAYVLSSNIMIPSVIKILSVACFCTDVIHSARPVLQQLGGI